VEWFLTLICHCRPDRCVAIGDWRSPVCARCFGFYIAFVVGICFFHFCSRKVWRGLPISLNALYVTAFGANGLTLIISVLDTNSYRFFAGCFLGLVCGRLVATRTRHLRRVKLNANLKMREAVL
jgi:uncharacterized membrane protein